MDSGLTMKGRLARTSPVAGLTSIVMPCFNRAEYILDALAAIRDQTWSAWELVVVDDGSTDDTAALVEAESQAIAQPVRIVRQDQAGAYAARARGLRETRGEYIAFYDSDDLWLPHHLQTCVGALAEHPQVDWVYSASRRVDAVSGDVVAESTFHDGALRRPFLLLDAIDADGLRIIDDPRVVECAIRSGLFCSLQVSVIRRRVFEEVPFRSDLRNGEDRFFSIRALKHGFRFAYFDEVHQDYRLHGDHSSAIGTGKRATQKLDVHAELVRGYSGLKTEVRLDARERRALRRRLADHLFWKMGYSLLWQNDQRAEALERFRQGLGEWPWDWRMWKTYLVSWLRTIGAGRRG